MIAADAVALVQDRMQGSATLVLLGTKMNDPVFPQRRVQGCEFVVVSASLPQS